MKDYHMQRSPIEERAVAIAGYIVANKATVRQAASQFGVSKSTVHAVVTIWNGGKVRLFGWLNRDKIRHFRWKIGSVFGIMGDVVLGTACLSYRKVYIQ